MLQEARDIVKKARAIIALVFYYFLFIFINLETLKKWLNFYPIILAGYLNILPFLITDIAFI